jgi:hypothetical protein
VRGWPCLAIAHQDVEGYIAAAGGNVRSWGEAEGADGQTLLDSVENDPTPTSFDLGQDYPKACAGKLDDGVPTVAWRSSSCARTR